MNKIVSNFGKAAAVCFVLLSTFVIGVWFVSEKYFDRYCLKLRNETTSTKQISLLNAATEHAGKGVVINQTVPSLFQPNAVLAATLVPPLGEIQVCVSESEDNSASWLVSDLQGKMKLLGMYEKSFNDDQWNEAAQIADDNAARNVDFDKKETYSVENVFIPNQIWIVIISFLAILNSFLLVLAFRTPHNKNAQVRKS